MGKKKGSRFTRVKYILSSNDNDFPENLLLLSHVIEYVAFSKRRIWKLNRGIKRTIFIYLINCVYFCYPF